MLNKLFGKKSQGTTSSATSQKADPANDPNMIRVFDEYGRELFIPKQQWRDNVLLGNLEKERDHPDVLYNLIVGAINDGFAADVISYAEHLKRIDPISARGATILGIAYMEVNRLDDAQQVFEEFVKQHGEDGIVLTNLAKVYSRRGDHVRAESILWHALELDPNQEHGLGWYAVIQKERNGEGADLEAYRRVAKLPRSWRSRLWLARDALQHQDLATAETLYKEALAQADQPVPADLLMQMSGDLGNAGHLADIIRLGSPHFDPVLHGLQVGNNFIKANLDLGRIQEANQIVEQLYIQNRPEWKQTLNYWGTEIAKSKISKQSQLVAPDKLAVSLIGIEGPLWMRDGSPFASLQQAKRPNAARVAILGSTAVFGQSSGSPGPQLTDTAGRFSRAIPLKLTEVIHVSTDAVGLTLVPWVTGQGFALFGSAYDDATLSNLTGKGEQASDFVVGFAINATQSVWKLNMWMVRCADGKRLEGKIFDGPIENIGLVVEQLSETLNQWLVIHAGARKLSLPDWYQKLPQQDEQDYLVRLEQQLAVLCKHFESKDNFSLYNEREILDGTLQLCVRQPTNLRVRMLYAQTLRQMKKARPEILSEYKDKTKHLQETHPLGREIDALLGKAYTESFK